MSACHARRPASWLYRRSDPGDAGGRLVTQYPPRAHAALAGRHPRDNRPDRHSGPEHQHQRSATRSALRPAGSSVDCILEQPVSSSIAGIAHARCPIPRTGSRRRSRAFPAKPCFPASSANSSGAKCGCEEHPRWVGKRHFNFVHDPENPLAALLIAFPNRLYLRV